MRQTSAVLVRQTFYQRPTSTPGTTQRGADMLTCPPALTVRPSTQSVYRLSTGPPASAIVTYILPLSPLSPESRHGYCSSARSQLKISLCPRPTTRPTLLSPLLPTTSPRARDVPFRFPGFFFISLSGARGKRIRVMTRASYLYWRYSDFENFYPQSGRKSTTTHLVSVAQHARCALSLTIYRTANRSMTDFSSAQ